VSLGNLKTPDTLSSRIAFNYRRDLSMPENSSKSRAAYWHANLKLMLGLLLVWFTISYLCGIVFVEILNHIRIGGYKLGFWFAQQGSMYGFVAIIFYYSHRMAKLDREFGVDEEDET